MSSSQNVNDGTVIRGGIEDGVAAAAAHLMGFDVKVSVTHSEEHPEGETSYTAFGDSQTWRIHLPDGQEVRFPLPAFLEAWSDPDPACRRLDDALEALPAEMRAQIDAVLPQAIAGWLRSYYDALCQWEEAEQSCPRQVMIQRPVRQPNGEVLTETVLVSADVGPRLKREWALDV